MNTLPFIPDYIYQRSAIHDMYKGNRQSGISTSTIVPYIFIFSGSTGEQYGYEDRWDNENVFSYTGAGQVGDMKFDSGNKALRDHLQNGKRVFLFTYVRPGYVKFESELEFHDVDYFESFDRNQNLRVAIKFFFKRAGAIVPIFNQPARTETWSEPEQDIYQIIYPNKTERTGLVTSRVGQGAYRKRIIHRWEYQCAVTKFDKLDILVASHIVPWSNATNEERLDVHNGILLSPTYDALFDRHLITFDHQGKIILSDKIEKQAYEKIGVTGLEKIDKLSQYNIQYLERHNERFNGVLI